MKDDQLDIVDRLIHASVREALSRSKFGDARSVLLKDAADEIVNLRILLDECAALMRARQAPELQAHDE
jgi:hypothetical protein